ncbi:MAG: hypothetical protein KC591_01130 [Gemmatimonadetes bacterium]|nr:hypothetical protein [Gemmatimonadota bacterium]
MNKKLGLTRQRIRLLSTEQGDKVVGGLPPNWTAQVPNGCTVRHPSDPCINDPTASVTILNGCSSCDPACG